LPDIFVIRKFLSSGYQLYACGKTFRMPRSLTKILLNQQTHKWKWSSFPATAYAVKTLDFLTVDWILRQFAKNKNEARKIYRNFVGDGLLKQEQTE
jgi:hypothetical protein